MPVTVTGGVVVLVTVTVGMMLLSTSTTGVVVLVTVSRVTTIPVTPTTGLTVDVTMMGSGTNGAGVPATTNCGPCLRRPSTSLRRRAAGCWTNETVTTGTGTGCC